MGIQNSARSAVPQATSGVPQAISVVPQATSVVPQATSVNPFAKVLTNRLAVPKGFSVTHSPRAKILLNTTGGTLIRPPLNQQGKATVKLATSTNPALVGSTISLVTQPRPTLASTSSTLPTRQATSLNVSNNVRPISIGNTRFKVVRNVAVVPSGGRAGVVANTTQQLRATASNVVHLQSKTPTKGLAAQQGSTLPAGQVIRLVTANQATSSAGRLFIIGSCVFVSRFHSEMSFCEHV